MTGESPQQQNWLTVGRLTSVYGIKGWVKLYSYTQPKENIFSYQPWFLQNATIDVVEAAKTKPKTKGQQQERLELLEIDDYRPQGQGLIVHIKGVDDRDQAKSFCQRDVLVKAECIPSLPDGEFYWHQLEGLKVFSRAIDAGSEPVLLGRIKRMLETGANDVMEVEPCEASLDQRERLIPFVPDHYATEVDLVQGAITLEWDPAF